MIIAIKEQMDNVTKILLLFPGKVERKSHLYDNCPIHSRTLIIWNSVLAFDPTVLFKSNSPSILQSLFSFEAKVKRNMGLSPSDNPWRVNKRLVVC